MNIKFNLKTGILFVFIVLLIALGWQKTETTAAAPIMESVTWQGEDFAQGSGIDTAVSPTGLTLADGAMTAVYTSDPFNTTPFNALVTSWEADVPTDTSLDIQVRTRKGSSAWSEWFHLDSHLDLVEDYDHENLSDMLTVPAVDGTHDTIQFSVGFGRLDTAVAPQLNQISFTVIDTTTGPTTEELLARQQAVDAANGNKPTGDSYPRPTVISREVWCTSVDCDYTDGLEYDDASHLIVHHTVSSNSSPDWAATLRAIWSFHTYPQSDSCSSCRGWGDIGYNYLIDQNGVIYEGHFNEDYENLDVVGTHAAAANTGSMGVALIGTFTDPDYPNNPGIAPPEAMKDSLIELLSWKADQRDINVYNSDATMPNVYGGRPNLMGHRNAYGTTECPGDQVHDLLPWLRDQVAANIGLVDPYSYVDELSSQFTRSSSSWLEGGNECGHNGHSYYTFSTTNPASSDNWGIWRPDIATADFGYYRLEVYAPYCFTGTGETDGATYEVSHYNGVSEVVLSHEEGIGQWNHLGNFVLGSDVDETIYLDDLVTTDDGLGVWFDGLRFVRLPDPEDSVTLVKPPPDGWTNQTSIDLRWAITSLNVTEAITVEIGTDSALTNVLQTESWDTAVYSTTFDYMGNMEELFWRVTAVFRQRDDSLNIVSTPITPFAIDLDPPTSQLTAVYKLSTGQYLLNWTGSDTLSGIASYTIDYRQLGSTTWTNLQADITETSSLFNPPEPTQQYEFRLRATDVAGNSQPPETPADPLGTQQAILLSHAIMIPIVTR